MRKPSELRDKKSSEPEEVKYRLRRAKPADLPELWRVYWDADHGPRTEMPDIPVPPIFRHELETGRVWVAEDEEGIAGFTAAITRGDVTYLAELFVRRGRQSAGLGRTLLRRAMPPRGRGVRCALSSKDPRALSLYIQSGMLPRWPNFQLQAPEPRLDELPVPDVQVVEADPSDRRTMARLARWDARIGGRERSRDVAYWLDQTDARPVWLTRRGRTIGYAFMSLRRHGRKGPGLAILGPIGSATVRDSAACVFATCRWARAAGHGLYLAVPGPHPALRPLFSAGFQIIDLETFVSSSDRDFADPRRYIASGGPEGSSLY